MQKKSTFIDFAKGLSICCVVAYHIITLYMKSLPEIVRYAANFGSSGVLVFFFCSGFGLTCLQAKAEQTYREFLSSRLVKIYIPYVLIVLISGMLPFLTNGKDPLISVLAHLLQFGTYYEPYFNTLGGHLWYIGTLLQFYLIYPFLYRTMQKLGSTKYLISCGTINLGYCVILILSAQSNNQVLIRFAPKYFVIFGAGMVCACEYLKNNDIIEKIMSLKAYYLVLTAVIGIVLTGLSATTPLGRLLNDIPAFVALLILFVMMYRFSCKMLQDIVLKIQSISYELYLVHMIFIVGVFHYFADGSLGKDILCATLSLLLSVFFACLYRSFIWLQSAVTNGHWCGGKRPQCGASAASLS